MKIASSLALLSLLTIILVNETAPPPTQEFVEGQATRWNERYGDGRDNAVEGLSYDLVAALDEVHEALDPPFTRQATDLIVWAVLFPLLLFASTAWAFRKRS